MIKDSEKYADEDKAIKAKIDAKNQFEHYIYQMKNSIDDKEKLAEIQREFVDQLKKKENQIVTMVKKSGGKPIQKQNTNRKKPQNRTCNKRPFN